MHYMMNIFGFITVFLTIVWYGTILQIRQPGNGLLNFWPLFLCNIKRCLEFLFVVVLIVIGVSLMLEGLFK